MPTLPTRYMIDLTRDEIKDAARGKPAGAAARRQRRAARAAPADRHRHVRRRDHLPRRRRADGRPRHPVDAARRDADARAVPGHHHVVARHLHADGGGDVRVARPSRRQAAADRQLARGQLRAARHRRRSAASRAWPVGRHLPRLLCRSRPLRAVERRADARRRDRGAGRARLPARARPSRPRRRSSPTQRSATRWTSCAAPRTSFPC